MNPDGVYLYINVAVHQKLQSLTFAISRNQRSISILLEDS